MPELSLQSLWEMLRGAQPAAPPPMSLSALAAQQPDDPWARYNQPFGEVRGTAPEDTPVAFQTRNGVRITEGDINRGLDVGMGAATVGGAGVKAARGALPMDEASRLARATEQGFTRDAYRGEGRQIEGASFIERHPGRYDPGFLGGDAIYSTNRPHLANDYATLKAAREFDDGAPNVMPLKVKIENPLTITSDDKRRIASMDRWDRDAWLRDDVYGKGHDGVIVKYGDGNPARRSSGYEEYVAPATSYRSRFAQFDPVNLGKSGLLGGLAATLGFGAAQDQPR